jgi:hypothetical protein
MTTGIRLRPSCLFRSTRRRRPSSGRPQVPSRARFREAGGGGQTVTRGVIGASALLLVIMGAAAGCGAAAPTGKGSPTVSTSPQSAASLVASPPGILAKMPTKKPTVTKPGPSVAKAKPAQAPAPTQSVPASAPASAPAPPVLAGGAFTESCPAKASSSTPGCGSWNAGASSGQAPGFAAGQQSSANLLGVNQDPWTGGQGPQVLSATSVQDWSVTATDTDPSNAPGEVLTYPDASFNYDELDTAASGYTVPPAQYDLNNITSLTSDFTESMPQISDLNAEAAYDLWLNNWKTEIMVWVDTSPAKDRNLADDGMTKVGTYTYDGQNFALWRSGSGITGFYVFLLDHNETSGSVDLKAMLETMVSLGYIPATSPLTQIPFGWEISDTGGKPVTLSLSKFDVNLQN